MNYTNKVCSFTGYRTKKLKTCLSGALTFEVLKSCLLNKMKEMLDEGFTTFQCGMAVGSDLIFAEAAIELKKRYSALVKFIAVIPCLEHDRGWNDVDRVLCRKVVENADEVILVSNSEYYDGCMAKRNRHLVETCDELIAVYDGQRGGTMQTINYAKGKGIKITIFDPSREVVITLRESFGETLKTERAMIYTP
ncbi:MAG: DUF1273 domain-containing protein [Oscillospiraceae bacterium]|nr:DUF1273 domain-containing protein [Oscillospiraceae bacterium]